MFLKKITQFAHIAAVSAVILSVIVSPVKAAALANNPSPKARVTFTFDDGLQSTITQAAPALAKYGYSGTSYVSTGCVGMTTVPNTCQADNDERYMTWAQIQTLRSQYNWEIGSHTDTHAYLASSDPDDQPTPLTPAQVTAQLANSKNALAAQGIDAKAFATPYGDYDNAVLAEIAKYYSSHRGFADTGYNQWPNSDYLIRDQQVQAGVSVDTVKGYIDEAAAKGEWLVLTFHDIATRPSSNPDDYEYSTANLEAIAAYVKSKNLTVSNISDSLVTGTPNILAANSSFNSGIGAGWTTDSPAQITADSGNHGSYPDATNSIKMTSGTKNSHLFSPKVAVSNVNEYMFKNFLNVESITSGGVGFYIDEYDTAGNWISGQYKVAEGSQFVQSLNFSYKPSSANVKQASLQVFTTANSGITAYLDNVQMFTLNQEVVPPAPTNLLTNGTFDAGLTGWTTNSATTITADTSNNGSAANQVNSVKLVSLADRNRHLFSQNVTVSSSSSYTITSFLKVAQISNGEIGYYIDEYDAAGNWISGQYKGGQYTTGSNTKTISYTPSSSNVATASLQVIVTGGTSNIVAYFDDAKWIVN